MKGTNISIVQLKEIYHPQIKNIVSAATVQIQESMKYDRNYINHTGKATRKTSQTDESMLENTSDQITKEVGRNNITTEQLREMHRPQVKEIVTAAEVQIEQTLSHYTRDNYDSGKAEGFSPSIKTIS